MRDARRDRGAEAAQKLELLADTDAQTTVVEQQGADGCYATSSYPVRDACRAALGRPKLRTG